MKALIETTTKRTERVFLVGLEFKNRSPLELQDSLSELSELAATAGAEVVGNGVQKLERPVAATFIGTGKADEFAAYCRREDVDTIIFDDELSPAQSRNLTICVQTRRCGERPWPPVWRYVRARGA